MPDAAFSAPILTPPQRLLVVDDEAVQRLMVAGIAERCGLVAEQAATIEQATDLISQTAFDVVVLDLALEHRDGIELLRCIRNSDCDPVVIFISGFDERVRQAAVRVASALGIRVTGALAKPLPLDALRALLTNLPDRPRAAIARVAAAIDARELASAIDANEIVCLYQPKVALADRRIVGVEVAVPMAEPTPWCGPAGPVHSPGRAAWTDRSPVGCHPHGGADSLSQLAPHGPRSDAGGERLAVEPR